MQSFGLYHLILSYCSIICFLNPLLHKAAAINNQLRSHIFKESISSINSAGTNLLKSLQAVVFRSSSSPLTAKNTAGFERFITFNSTSSQFCRGTINGLLYDPGKPSPCVAQILSSFVPVSGVQWLPLPFDMMLPRS